MKKTNSMIFLLLQFAPGFSQQQPSQRNIIPQTNVLLYLLGGLAFFLIIYFIVTRINKRSKPRN